MLLAPPKIKRHRFPVRDVKLVISNWIRDNTRSTTKTTKVITINTGESISHNLVHYRSQAISKMYYKFTEDFPNVSISFSSFYRCLPLFLKKETPRSGLCERCSTGYEAFSQLLHFRRSWHQDCTCECALCVSCNHGLGDEKHLTKKCEVCSSVRCPIEWSSNTIVSWRQTQKTRNSGKTVLTLSSRTGTRAEFLTWWSNRMDTFLPHNLHVDFHKRSLKSLRDNLPPDWLIARKDFIMNLRIGSPFHQIQSQHFGQRQASFYVVVLSYRLPDSRMKNFPVLFISDYLGHNPNFVLKAWNKICSSNLIPAWINHIVIQSDGAGNQFYNRHTLGNIFDATNLDRNFSMEWWIDPPGHGKGLCDTVASVVKRSIFSYLRENASHVFNDTQDLFAFLSTNPTYETFLLDFDSHDCHESISKIKDLKSFYNFHFHTTEDVVQCRKWPCSCYHCIMKNFAECLNYAKTGSFCVRKISVSGVVHALEAVGRHQPHLQPPLSTEVENEEILGDVNDAHVEEDPVYEVQKISDLKVEDNVKFYLVHWAEDPDNPTWERESNLSCPDLLEEFFESTKAEERVKEFFEVEEILDEKMINFRKHYLVKFAGWGGPPFFVPETDLREENLEILEKYQQRSSDEITSPIFGRSFSVRPPSSLFSPPKPLRVVITPMNIEEF